jgi:hypothetical protein
MKKYLIFFAPLFFILISEAKVPSREFYEIRIYHVKNDAQEKRVEDYLQNALLPALHTAGISKIGVFKPIEKDTADRKVYLMIPYASLEDVTRIQEKLNKDKTYNSKGAEYLDTKYDNPTFNRIETIFLQAFSHQPLLQTPELTSNRNERVYELRSYEGYSEKIFKNKVQMFNEGGEVTLFKRLGFNAVFYAEVIAGSRMPNLMYMTTFENQASRDAHWKTFVDDPEWKKLSSMPEYKNNVSKIDIFFLRPASYSDY